MSAIFPGGFAIVYNMPHTHTARITGVVLAVATLAEILVMAHHPSVRTSDPAAAAQQIAALAPLAQIVHGVLIALMLLIAYGLSEFVLRREPARPLIRAGTIAYATGVLVMTGAALVSGFILPALAISLPRATQADLQLTKDLFILCRVLNQTCAHTGAVAMSVGIGLWSIGLLRGRGALKLTGVLGCVIGAAVSVALLTGTLALDVHGMLVVILAQALWNLAVATLLVLSQVEDNGGGTQKSLTLNG
jgi:hypothetical protein